MKINHSNTHPDSKKAKSRLLGTCSHGRSSSLIKYIYIQLYIYTHLYIYIYVVGVLFLRIKCDKQCFKNKCTPTLTKLNPFWTPMAGAYPQPPGAGTAQGALPTREGAAGAEGTSGPGKPWGSGALLGEVLEVPKLIGGLPSGNLT